MMRPVRTPEEFFAHALAIEREAAARYGEMHLWFRDGGEEVLAGLCRNLAEAEGQHLKALERRCEGLDISAIDPADYQWPDGESPEAPRREAIRRATTKKQLMNMALAAERSAAAFFEWVASTSPDASVRELAHELAAEEETHVRWLRDALEYQAH
jgi:rubrerythrin